MQFHAHGKLLLTAEYLVLGGATALALPTRPGQSLHLAADASPGELHWTSRTHDGHHWLQARFSTTDWQLLKASDQAVAQRLQQILRTISKLEPDFAEQAGGTRAETRLDFPRNWGLGSSSTLLHLLAQWSQTDAWQLLDQTFGGSGYDLAAAAANGPILYRRLPKPESKPALFYPPFRDQLCFVYLEEKKNSREGIARYREREEHAREVIPEMDRITQAILHCSDFRHFAALLRQHEKLLADLLDLPRVQDERFPDYPGTIKSLGAWGGDFVLATMPNASFREVKNWFTTRGYPTVLSYDELILPPA